MEGHFSHKDEFWLFNFRQKINSLCDPIEFAKNAIKYDPYPTNTLKYRSNKQKEDDRSQRLLKANFKCEGLKILDVSSVYRIGSEAFITCSDVKINLYKIYIYLTEAISRLRAIEHNDEDQKCRECLSSLNSLLKIFDGYIKICMRLSQDLKYTPLKNTKNENTHISSARQFHKFREITSKFKVDQLELNRLFEMEFDESTSKGLTHCSSESLTLLWSFYREATCSDIFALLCYTLFTANPFAYKSLLENYEPCIKSHLNENWKVLLSYIPISFEFKDYQYVFESVLFNNNRRKSELESGSSDECLISSFIDWCLWRIYLIVKYTNSSYFLFIRFIKNMTKLLTDIDRTPVINKKLQLLNFLKFIIKQYFIYQSLNSKVNCNENLNIAAKDSSGVEGTERMSFFEYLELDASKKLCLFCEFEVSQTNQDCECEEQYKDKHKIYSFCIQCKTRNLSNKLKSFFVLISPASVSTNTTNTPNTTRQSSPNGTLTPDSTDAQSRQRYSSDDVNYGDSSYGDFEENGGSLENDYVLMNEGFRDFYESLISSYNSGLNDYLSGISESFMKQLNVRSFEILYTLSAVLLETGFRNKLFSIFLQIVYSGSSEYNFVENYFLIKSTFALITSCPDLNNPEDTFDTRSTLFRLLKHFDVSKEVCNNAYSGYKKFVMNLVRRSREVQSDGEVKYADSNSGSHGGVGSNVDVVSDDSGFELNVETLVSCINCQLDFVEVLLNILSLINAGPSGVLTITPRELMVAMVSEEHCLVMLQKILVFIIDLSLDPLEFSNCLFELVNLSSYISSLDVHSIQNMFFYTIASKNNLNYINQQLQLWYNNTSTVNVGGDLKNGTLERAESFLSNSLNCVLNVVYRMDISCNINMFQLLVNCCKFVPVNSRFYNTQWRFDGLSIYSVIALYVNYVNSNSNIRTYLDSKDSSEAVKESSDKLNMLVILSKVYKSVLLFDCYNLVTLKRHEHLEYRFYDSSSLIERSFGTLLSLLNESTGGKDGVTVSRVRVEKGVYEKGDELLLLVFKCILENVLSNKVYTTKLFDDLKVAIGHLCPKDMTNTLLNLVSILSSVTENAHLEDKQCVNLESDASSLTGLCVNIMIIIYLGLSNLLVISNLIQLCVCRHLSNSMTFIYNNLMRTGVTDEFGVNTGQDVDVMSEEELTYHPEPYNNDALKSGLDNEDDSLRGFESEYEHSEDQRTDLEIEELFNYGDGSELYREDVYDDAYFRKCVLNMLDVDRSEKTGVRQSIGKFANKFGTNVASGFITAAIEKAEGELLNIAKRTQKLDILKDKLFYQKKQAGVEKSMYAPILNYSDRTVMFPVSLYDQEGEHENELLQYRNLGEITVSRLVSLNVEMACLMLMECCSYKCNSVFLKHMQSVFNKNEIRSVCKFLEKLEPYLVHTNWPELVVDKIRALRDFLRLFTGFPENVTISASSFVYNKEYRISLFKTVPSYVAGNLQLVQEIYKSLKMFYKNQTHQKPGLKQDVQPSIDNIQEYLFGPISVSVDEEDAELCDETTDALDGVEARDRFDEMDEYVEVLFNVYTEIFYDDFNIQSFLNLEPLFLLNREKYVCFLQKLYYNLTCSSNAPGTPSSQPGYNLRNYAGSTSMTPSASRAEGLQRLEVNNVRLIMVRRCVYNLLAVYPELNHSFSMLYRADSLDVIKFLEKVFQYVPEFDLSLVDNFELFKQRLISVLTFDNFFFIADGAQVLDPDFSAAIYRRLERGLRPHSDDIVDCTRLLFEYDLSNTTL